MRDDLQREGLPCATLRAVAVSPPGTSTCQVLVGVEWEGGGGRMHSWTDRGPPFPGGVRGPAAGAGLRGGVWAVRGRWELGKTAFLPGKELRKKDSERASWTPSALCLGKGVASRRHFRSYLEITPLGQHLEPCCPEQQALFCLEAEELLLQGPPPGGHNSHS